MDILIIAIFIIFLAGIGYILSRPFVQAEENNDFTIGDDDLVLHYASLKNEIELLESKFENEEMAGEYLDLLDEKKREIEQLQNQMGLDEEKPPQPEEIIVTPEISETQPKFDLSQDGSYVCPQCGNRVYSSDKFCPNCGHQLIS